MRGSWAELCWGSVCWCVVEGKVSGADVVAVTVGGDANESASALLMMGSVMLKTRGPLATDGRYYIALAFFASERRVYHD